MIVKDNKGYTLVELLVVMSIFLVVITVIGNYAVDNMRRIAITNARSEILNEAQVGLDVLTSDIRLAASAQEHNRWPDNNAPNAPGDLFSWSSSSNTLVLASPTINNSKEIVYSDPSQYISEKDDKVYYVKDKTLYKRIVASTASGNSAKTTCPKSLASQSCPADKTILSNVTSMQIKYLNNANEEVAPYEARSIEFTVNLSIEKFKQPVNVTYTSRAVFRNV
jgi:prepilin-type N-terminal cleavage/methylation domain-containing protein